MYDRHMLRRLQLTQLEMLKMVKAICEEHDISFSLYGGTLLGAVRHKAFIPWDDDLVICMARSEFSRFVQAWENKEPDGYYLQTIEKDEEFTQTFAKIRKKGTTFVQQGDLGLRYNKGIFIDIFILDKVPKNKCLRLLQRGCGYLNLLYSRKFPPYDNGALTRLLGSLLLKVVPKNRYRVVRAFCVRQLAAYNKTDANYYIDSSTVKALKRYIPKSAVEEIVFLEFEGELFPCFSDWDNYLQQTYGNYMDLPPVEERVMAHSAICIDFERSYEEVLAESNNNGSDRSA